MRSMALVLAMAVGVLSGVSPATAQQSGSSCVTDTTPIYHAEGRYFTGTLRVCSYRRVTDLTTGPDRPRSGEQTFATDRPGRNAFVRGRPNYPYIIREAEFDAWQMRYIDTTRGHRWSRAAMSLPFIPTEAYYLGSEDGIPKYGYGRPAFLPSRRNQAYPIDENSVIIAVGGIGFMSPETLQGMLTAPDEDGYVEVYFFQRNENPAIFRRAFIPIFSRASVNAEYQGVVSRYGLDRSGSDQLGSLGRTVLILGALWVAYEAYYRSGLARALDTPCDPGSMVCWRDPLLDLMPN